MEALVECQSAYSRLMIVTIYPCTCLPPSSRDFLLSIGETSSLLSLNRTSPQLAGSRPSALPRRTFPPLHTSCLLSTPERPQRVFAYLEFSRLLSFPSSVTTNTRNTPNNELVTRYRLSPSHTQELSKCPRCVHCVLDPGASIASTTV